MDSLFLQQALDLAKIRRGFCASNPSVGAVITRDNEVLATGYHFAAGHPHAEVDALSKLEGKAPNATAYVTLEPCCHWGKTPPCTDALIHAGVQRVVYGYRDPNPLVAGKGKAALEAAGIICEYQPNTEIEAFYESYQYWQKFKKPFITIKIAQTIDGRITKENTQPVQITGPELQEFTHYSRKHHDAILTTVKTILQDNPQLNARYQNETIAKPIYILDSQLNTPPNAQVFSTAKTLTIFHSEETAGTERQQQLISQGVRCIPIKENNQGLNLVQVIEVIGKDGIHDLWVEAGAKCFTTFVSQKLAQRILIYIAPWVLGEGLSTFNDNADFRSQKITWQQFGQDVLCDIRLVMPS